LIDLGRARTLLSDFLDVMNLPAELRKLIGVFDSRLQLPYGSFGAQ
jgi:hypothetical protein